MDGWFEPASSRDGATRIKDAAEKLSARIWENSWVYCEKRMQLDPETLEPIGPCFNPYNRPTIAGKDSGMRGAFLILEAAQELLSCIEATPLGESMWFARQLRRLSKNLIKCCTDYLSLSRDAVGLECEWDYVPSAWGAGSPYPLTEIHIHFDSWNELKGLVERMIEMLRPGGFVEESPKRPLSAISSRIQCPIARQFWDEAVLLPPGSEINASDFLRKQGPLIKHKPTAIYKAIRGALSGLFGTQEFIVTGTRKGGRLDPAYFDYVDGRCLPKLTLTKAGQIEKKIGDSA